MQDPLLQRADKAIAESERLMDELSVSMEKAKWLDRYLHYLHWRRIEEQQPRHKQ